MNAPLAAGRAPSRGSIIDALVKALSNASGRMTNIESVIAESGVSAQDIAATFASNRELILEMASQLSESMSSALGPASTSADLRQRLIELGQRVTEVYSSYLRGLYRIAITESIRHTGLGRDFYDIGPGRLEQRLADFLQAAQLRNLLDGGNHHLLASHFLAALRANLDIADTFVPATNPAATTQVHHVVDLFLNGIDAGGHRAELN